MSKQDAQTQGEAFADFWNELLREHPRYFLDFSWPSVGTVDLILHRIRRRPQLSEVEERWLFGAACYLAVIAARCWEHFPGAPAVTVDCQPEKRTVHLTASGGKLFQARESFSVEVTAALQSALMSDADPWQFLSCASRPRSLVENVTSLFGLGLCTGMCPAGAGPWANMSDAKWVPQIQATDMVLSITAAAHYQRVNPSEMLGGDPNLYRQCLIFPPLGHRESTPASKAASGIIAYLRNNDVPDEDGFQLAMNLAYSPDELLSAAGFVVAVAMTDAKPNLRLMLLSESRGVHSPRFRFSIEVARGLLKKEEIPLQALTAGDLEACERLILPQVDLHLLPLLRIPVSCFAPPQLHSFFHLLISNKPHEARALFDLVSANIEMTASLLLQAAFLDLQLGDFERSKLKLLEVMKTGQLEEGLIALAKEIEAAIYLRSQQREDALSAIEQGLIAPSSEGRKKLQLLNLKVELLIALSRYQDAETILSENHELFEQSLRALFNSYVVQQKLGQDSESLETLQKLVRYAPMDQRIFRSLVRVKERAVIEGTA